MNCIRRSSFFRIAFQRSIVSFALRSALAKLPIIRNIATLSLRARHTAAHAGALPRARLSHARRPEQVTLLADLVPQITLSDSFVLIDCTARLHTRATMKLHPDGGTVYGARMLAERTRFIPYDELRRGEL
jgi:hypothetical protein